MSSASEQEEARAAPPHDTLVAEDGTDASAAYAAPITQGSREPTARHERPSNILTTAVAVTIVVACWAILQLWGLGKTPFHTKGEPREALVVQQILAGGGWVLPRRNGVELPSKPPLFHWLGALTAMAHKQLDERAVRLPSALLSGAAALLVVITGARFWGARAGAIAALALLTSFEWQRAATTARVDMTLTAALCAALCSMLMLRAGGGVVWTFLLYAGIASAVLSKGPIGLALPLLQILAVCVADRSASFARGLRLERGLLAVVLIGGAWYALALAQGGRAFFDKQLIDENALRVLGGQRLGGSHAHSVFYLAGALLAGLLPWTFLLPSTAVALWRARRTLARNDARIFLVVWIAVVFGVYAVATAKRGVYLLSLYPAVFLLVGWWFDALIRDRAEARWLPRVLAPLAWGIAALLGLLVFAAASERLNLPLVGAIVDFVGPRAKRDVALVVHTLRLHGLPLMLLFAAGATAAALAAVACSARRWGIVFIGWLTATAAVTVAVRQVILPEVARADTRANFIAAVGHVLGDNRDLYFYRSFDYGSVFYWRHNIPVFDGNLSAAAPQRLLMAESDWVQADATARRFYARVPLVESGRAGNLGRIVLVQRVTEPTAAGAAATPPGTESLSPPMPAPE